MTTIPTPEQLQEATAEMMKSNPFAPYMPDAETLASMVPAMGGLNTLTAKPIGAMVAGSAIAMGMTSQMYGLMFGAMTGAMEATSKLSKSEFEGPAIPSKMPNPFAFEWAFGEPATIPTPEKVKAVVKKPVAKKPATKKAAPAESEASAPSKPAPVKKATAKTVAAAPKPVAAKKPAAAKKPVAAKKSAPVAKPAASAAAPMPEDFVKPASIAKPAKADDLKKISGVGPKLEQVLNGLGIWTYDQIAGWSINEVAWVDDYMQLGGRIERDGWVAKAAELTSASK